MYKVFIAEDEDSIREEIRRLLEDAGFSVCGEAADGELALPMIQELKPDILITDINMPFMNGLELSTIVKSSMPWVHVMILSGFDEFDYAQKAIEIGVDSYMLKPIDEQKTLQSMAKVVKSIEAERKDMLDALGQRQRDEQDRIHQREHFFNCIINGSFDMDELYRHAEKLDIRLLAQKYVLCYIPSDDVESSGKLHAYFREALAGKEDAFGFCYGDDYLIIIKGSTDEQAMELSCEVAQTIKHEALRLMNADITVNIGNVANRIRELADSYKEMRKGIIDLKDRDERNIVRILSLSTEPPAQIDFSASIPLAEKLRHAEREDLDLLIDNHFMASEPEEPGSILYRYYLLVDLVVTSVRFLKDIGLEEDAELLSKEVNSQVDLLGRTTTYDLLKSFARDFLEKVIEKRDKNGTVPHFEEIKKAKEYIMEHYSDEGLSLHTVAREVGFSPNHFSTVFSQQMGVTFIEYLIHYRIEQSKELLEHTDMKLADIAFRIGYNEPRYFGHVFKKLTGMTPGAYRKQCKKSE